MIEGALADTAANRANKPGRPKESLVLIQVLRGIAALMVVVHHATILADQRLGVRGAIWVHGASGVDIFFVISGFVMALSSRGLAGKARPALEFLKRRVERIVPLYWLATTLKLVLTVAIPASAVNGIGSGWNIAASYLFLPSRNASGLLLPVLIVGWTLNFEMMFYAWFAAALALRIKPLRLLVPVMGILAVLGLALPRDGSAAVFYCDTIVLEFVFGMGLYWLYARGRRLSAGVGLVTMVAGFAILMVAPETRWRGLEWGLPALGIVAGAIGLEGRIGTLVPRWLREIGDSSYSLYLAHGFALPVAAILLTRMHVAPGTMLVAAVAVSVGLSVTVGELVYRGVERPMVRWFARRRSADLSGGGGLVAG